MARGKVQKKFFDLHEEICQFLESKGKDTTELRDEKWRCELAFLCDITMHLTTLNLQLQGRGHVITHMYNAVKAFQTKLRLWETQIQQGNLVHFPCCQTLTNHVSTAVFPTAHFADKLGALGTEFTRQSAPNFLFELFSNPFAVDMERASVNLQMELIDLQCNDTLKAKYDSVGAAQFPSFIPEKMAQLLLHAAQMLCMFGSTYLCEQLFSVMKMNKNPHRSRLTDAHLHSILRVSTAQNLTPNIDELTAKKRC